MFTIFFDKVSYVNKSELKMSRLKTEELRSGV